MLKQLAQSEAPVSSGGSLLEALNVALASRTRTFWVCLLCCAGIYLAMTFGVPLAIQGLYAGDMNQNLGWGWRLMDPHAFPGDVRVDYQEEFYAWPGLKVVDWLILKLASVEMTGKLLALAIGAAMLFVAYRIGARLAGGRAGGLIGSLTLAGMFRPTELNIWAAVQGGMPRSFGYLFLLITILALIEERHVLLGVALCAAPLFYPPAGAVGFGTAALILANDLRLQRGKRLKILISSGATLLAMLPLALWFGRRISDSKWGSPPTLGQAYQLAVLRPGGTLPILPTNTALGCWLATHGGLTATITILLFAFGAVALVLVRTADRLAKRAVATAIGLLAVSLCGYAAAYALFFRLYHPSRYTSYGPQLVLWLLVCVVFIEGLRRTRTVQRWLSIALHVCWLVALVVGVLCAANLRRIWPRAHDAGHTGLYRTAIPDDVIAAIHALPANAMIAGHPEIAGDVPFLTGRSVYLQIDDLFPYKMAYYQTMLRRLDAQQQAFFASEWASVDSFAKAEKVGYLLVDRRSYRPGYADWAASYPQLAVPSRGEFVLLAPPRRRLISASGDFLLVRIGD